MLIWLTLYNLCFLTENVSSEVIEEKYYHYIDSHGTSVSINGSGSHENFTFSRLMYIDLTRSFYIIDVNFEVDDGINTLVNTSVTGQHLRFGPVEHCSMINESLNYLNFNCRKISRFIQVEVILQITVVSINLTGHGVFHELYIGCYSFIIPLQYLISNLATCINSCYQKNYSFAGVKESRCSCYNRITWEITNYRLCYKNCLQQQICGGIGQMSIYFTDLSNTSQLEPDCVIDDVCKTCRPGRTGATCRRDCSMNNGGCGAFRCNTIGTYNSVCACPIGFRPDFRTECTDLDECFINIHECGLNAVCKNIIGSYECHCSNGFVRLNESCNDIDECNGNMCDREISTCMNTDGSYHCECHEGFQPQDNFNCIDIDECIINACDKETSNCMNTEGSYICDCLSGFEAENKHGCIDIDECSRNICDEKTTICMNTEGFYKCHCLRGFEAQNDFECIDIDECERGQHSCKQPAVCENKLGSYYCSCSTGMKLEVFHYLSTCEDIDECEKDTLCGQNFICLNFIGSYSCQCLSGYFSNNEFVCGLDEEIGSTNFSSTFSDGYDYYTSTDGGILEDEKLMAVFQIYGVLLLLVAIAVFLICIVISGRGLARRHSIISNTTSPS